MYAEDRRIPIVTVEWLLSSIESGSAKSFADFPHRIPAQARSEHNRKRKLEEAPNEQKK